EGRSRQDHDRHQPGGVLRLPRRPHAAGRLRSPVQRLQRPRLPPRSRAAQQATLPTELDRLSMIPAHKNLLGANIELVPLELREYRLRNALQPLRDEFQFIVIDCPPALDLLT